MIFHSFLYVYQRVYNIINHLRFFCPAFSTLVTLRPAPSSSLQPDQPGLFGQKTCQGSQDFTWSYCISNKKTYDVEWFHLNQTWFHNFSHDFVWLHTISHMISPHWVHKISYVLKHVSHQQRRLCNLPVPRRRRRQLLNHSFFWVSQWGLAARDTGATRPRYTRYVPFCVAEYLQCSFFKHHDYIYSYISLYIAIHHYPMSFWFLMIYSEK